MDPILAIGHDLLKILYSVLPDNYILYDSIYIYIYYMYTYTPVITQIDMERLGRPIFCSEIYSSAAFVGIMGVM